MRIAVFVSLGLVLSTLVYSQKITSTTEQVWGGYFNQTRLSNKWGFWAEGQLRTKEDFFNKLSLGLVRVGGTYYLSDNAKLTVGYAFINHFPADAHPDISQPEHRPWQQIQWHTKFSKLRMMQWVRLEERYRRKIKDNDELAEGYNFNYRARYNMLLGFPLSKRAFAPNTFSFLVNNEVHVNFGKAITYNSFDQNRLFLGFNFHTSDHDQLQFGYMNVFQQLPAGNRYRYLHTARIGFFHNIDLRPKPKELTTPG